MINKLRELESIISPLILASITEITIALMCSICTIASQDTQTDKIFIIYYKKFYFISYTFIGIIKLLFYFHFGEMIPNSFNRMKDLLEELFLTNMSSIEEWKQWKAIQKMEKQFNFSIMKLFNMKRKTAVIIGSFILQYVVILLQTNA